jgi:hypothetical protein
MLDATPRADRRAVLLDAVRARDHEPPPSRSKPAVVVPLHGEPARIERLRDIFLNALHPDDHRYMAAFRDEMEPRVKNLKAADLKGVADFAALHAPNRNVYVGVAARDGKGRSVEHCLALYALFVDIDFKHVAELDARAALAAFPLQPSAVVQSGGGLHSYWFLTEPFVLQGTGATSAKQLLRALARAVGADLDSAEPARILRLPGTLNRKYDPPRAVVLESIEVERRYALRDFLGVLTLTSDDKQPAAERPVKHGVRREGRMRLARAWVERRPIAIEGDHGDTRTHVMCCSVAVGFDLSDDDAYEVLREWNARCEPPWSEADLRKKLRGSPSTAKERRGGRLTFRKDKKTKAIVATNQWNIWLGLAKLDAELGFDAFAQKPRARWRGCDSPLNDAIRDDLWLDFDARLRFRPPPDFFDTVMRKVARANTFHPVRRYLDGVRWDGVKRLDAWLIDYAGAADTAYVRAVGAKPLIAAVRRVRAPGSKFDELMVLESEQGTLKSSALRTLCPDEEWFSDDLPLGADAKEIIERTAGKWVIEASELYGSARDVDRLKSMLSRQVDGPVRLAYARLPVEVPRQWIAIGTTNDRGGYLKDSTGARRFWPVRVKQFDLARLREHRDQLWAEAAHREAAGESIRLDPRFYDDAAREQEQRRLMDPWEELIVDGLSLDDAPDYVEGKRVWMVLQSLAHARDNRHAARVEKIMQRLGYPTKKRLWGKDDNGDRKRRWVWIREGAAEQPEQGELQWIGSE